MPTPQQRSNKSLTPKHNPSRSAYAGKENIKNIANLTINDQKNQIKKPLSPLSKASNTPKVKKV